MKLIGSLTSPYVRKVRIVMIEKGLQYTWCPEDIASPDSKISEVNPLGKIPCLVLPSGEALFDSSVIVDYLDTLSAVSLLIPEDPLARARVKTWEALADGLLDASILVRNEETWPKRKDSERCQAWIDRQMKKIHDSLAAMEKALEGRATCEGGLFTLADIAVGCAVGYLDLRFPSHAWKEHHPNLARLQDQLSQRPSFIETSPPLS
jgi:glutathione S-transferase